VEPTAEAAFYHQHATQLAGGLDYHNPETGAPTAFLPPGYPLLLAGPYRLFGASPDVGAFVNIALALLTLTAVYFIADRFFGSRVALLGGLAYAVFPSQVLYINAVHPAHLITAAAAALLWVALPRDARVTRERAVFCGLILGLSMLTKPVSLLLLPALVFSWRLSLPWKPALGLAGVAAAISLLVVSPWLVRNWVQVGSPTLATNGGVNLWIGHNPDADGGWMAWDDEAWAYPEDEKGSDARYRAEAIRYALSDPLATLRSSWVKLDLTFEQDFTYVEHFSFTGLGGSTVGRLDLETVRDWNERFYRLVIVASLLTIPALIRLRHPAMALLPPAVALVVPVVLFFGMDRFHIPLLPLLIVFAAGLARWLLVQEVRSPAAGRALAPSMARLHVPRRQPR
jgi:4-amino-4-deoxy-L-arabinose transferase-like glycosyltransferase